MNGELAERMAHRGAGERLAHLGDRVLEGVDVLGRFALLAGATFRAARRPRFPWRETLRQLEAIGARSMSIVLITARFGAKLYVGGVVALALARELGPVLTALMVGGRVGAGISAEIGAMQVTEQVDAIRSMGADPVQKLVLPRALAATLALPLLTALANVLGVVGGMAIAVTQFGITANFYIDNVFWAITLEDVMAGLVKTFAFGWIIAMVGCFMAFETKGGTVGVGRSTTLAVVVASISILISDFFLTKLMMAL